MGRRGRGLPENSAGASQSDHSIGLADLVSRDLGGVAGYAVGVLHIRTPFVFVPGNLQNAITLPFPVAYECAKGVTLASLLKGSDSVGRALVAAAKRLEKRGARVIVGACGSFAKFQTRLAAAVGVPVFSSILGQLPWLLASIPESQRVAVIFADRRSFTRSMQRECGIADIRRLVVADCMGIPEFKAMIDRPYRLAHSALQLAVVRHAQRLVQEHPDIGMVVLQCSELPPYAAAIQAAIQRPIADIVTLTEWAHSSQSAGRITTTSRTTMAFRAVMAGMATFIALAPAAGAAPSLMPDPRTLESRITVALGGAHNCEHCNRYARSAPWRASAAFRDPMNWKLRHPIGAR